MAEGRAMSIKGFTRTILATEFAEAYAKDNNLSDCGYNFGKNIGNWLKDTADYISEINDRLSAVNTKLESASKRLEEIERVLASRKIYVGPME